MYFKERIKNVLNRWYYTYFFLTSNSLGCLKLISGTWSDASSFRIPKTLSRKECPLESISMIIFKKFKTFIKLYLLISKYNFQNGKYKKTNVCVVWSVECTRLSVRQCNLRLTTNTRANSNRQLLPHFYTITNTICKVHFIVFAIVCTACTHPYSWLTDATCLLTPITVII